MNKMSVVLTLIALSLTAAKAEELVLGYITHIPSESKDARKQRHELIAQRRAGIPLLVNRGASKDAPENTLEAYNAAMDLGADDVEIDIRRTRDGVLYLFHDETLDRLTNGSGKVKNMSYYELLKLAPKRIYGRADNDTRTPTLAAFLVLARRANSFLQIPATIRQGNGKESRQADRPAEKPSRMMGILRPPDRVLTRRRYVCPFRQRRECT